MFAIKPFQTLSCVLISISHENTIDIPLTSKNCRQAKFCLVAERSYNHFHNILRFFDVLPNFPFTTSEMMGDYYL